MGLQLFIMAKLTKILLLKNVVTLYLSFHIILVHVDKD